MSRWTAYVWAAPTTVVGLIGASRRRHRRRRRRARGKRSTDWPAFDLVAPHRSIMRDDAGTRRAGAHRAPRSTPRGRTNACTYGSANAGARCSCRPTSRPASPRGFAVATPISTTASNGRRGARRRLARRLSTATLRLASGTAPTPLDARVGDPEAMPLGIALRGAAGAGAITARSQPWRRAAASRAPSSASCAPFRR